MSEKQFSIEHDWKLQFENDEATLWQSMLKNFESIDWEAFSKLLWDSAGNIKMASVSANFLFEAYRLLEDDFAKANTFSLLARISLFFPEDERLDVYQRMMLLEEEANSFLRSRLIQTAGLFSHVLDNSMLVAGQLAARRPENNPYCAMAHVRALKRAYLVHPDSTIEKVIERYQQASDTRVRAEALLQGASIRLVRLLAANDRSELLAQLDDIRAALDAVSLLEPDRPDTAQFSALLDACRALASLPINRLLAAETAAHLRALWRTSLTDDDGGLDESSIDIECLFVEAVERITAILEQVEKLPYLVDASGGLIAIAEAAVFLQGLSDLGFGQGSPSELAVSILARLGFNQYVDTHVKRSLWTGVQHAKAKVQMLLTGNVAETSPDTALYLRGVLDVFRDIERGTVSRFESGVLVTLGRALPSKSPEEIEATLVEHQARGSLDQFLLDVLAQSTAPQTSLQVREYLGGYPKAQRILRRMRDELATHLSDERPELLANFMNVLTHVVRYLFVASERRIPVPFLMSTTAGGKGEGAVEADLEDSLHMFLLNSNLAFAIRRQANAATGRTDLAFHFGDLFFPLEIKREKKDLSPDHLRAEYLAQAATYTRAYDRLGLFLVLDVTRKVKGEPLVDLENLVWLVEMTPAPGTTTLHVPVPDYVVTCIVPGNQPRPSDLSSYS